MFPEPHSTKQIEDCIGWGHEIAPATLVDTVAGRIGCTARSGTPSRRGCAGLSCPVLVVHGTDDRIRTARDRRSGWPS